jgi:signal transduction histidine kinase
MRLLLTRHLRARLALRQTFSFALLVIILAWSAYGLLARHVYGEVDDEVQDRSIAVRTMLQVRDRHVRWLNQEADSEVREQFEHSIRFYQFLDEHGQVLDSSRELSRFQLPLGKQAQSTLATGITSYETIQLANGISLRISNSRVQGSKQQFYLLRLGISLTDIEDRMAKTRFTIIALLLMILLIHGANAWLMAGKALRPLDTILAAAKQITPFDAATRLPVVGNHDEFDELSTAMNGAIARLQSSYQRMSDFLRNLSHEIRQPLTIMRSETEQALRFSHADAKYRETLTSQLEQIDLLARTISGLMELAHSDNDAVTLHCQSEDLSELIQAAIDGMRLKPNDRNIQISGIVQKNILGQFDAAQVWRLILNLLDNAIKFNRLNGRVDVSLTSHDGVALLSISDTGTGIPREEQTRIFDRGYRTPSARGSGVPGTGLGLHFARSIAHAHGGRIEFSSVAGEGTCFRVTLPLSRLSLGADDAEPTTLDPAIH